MLNSVQSDYAFVHFNRKCTFQNDGHDILEIRRLVDLFGLINPSPRHYTRNRYTVETKPSHLFRYVLPVCVDSIPEVALSSVHNIYWPTLLYLELVN